MTMDKPPRQITGRMVLFGFVAFFAVVGAVNGIMMYMALSTWPGLVSQHAYKEGIRYNQTLADAEVQHKLGWQSKLSLTKDGKVEAVFMDKENAPLDGLTVEVSMYRAVGDERVFKLTLSESRPGIYGGRFEAPLPGRWKADIHAHNQAAHYRMIHEVMIQP